MAVQKAILQGRDITESILSSVTINYGADMQKFINYSKSKNPFWVNTTGLYRSMELEVIRQVSIGIYEGKPAFKEMQEFRVESEENTSSQVRDWFVLHWLEAIYNLRMNSQITGSALTGNGSDVVANYIGYTVGARTYVQKRSGGYPETFYDQSVYPFTIKFMVMNSQGVWRPHNVVYNWDYSPEKRVELATFTREENTGQVYHYVGSMSDKVAWQGFGAAGGFNALSAWKPEKRTNDEMLAGRYFVDPVPIVVRGEKASGTYGATLGVPSTVNLNATKHALKLLSVDFDEMYDAVMDVNNQDKLKLLSAEVEFSLFVRNNSPAVVKALWLTFMEAYKYAFTSYEKFTEVKAIGSIVRADFFPGNQLGSSVFHNYIKYDRNLSGTIGYVGSHRSRVVIREATFTITRASGEQNNKDFEYDNSDLILEKQVSPGKYDRLTINGLQRTSVYYPSGGNTNQQRIIKNLKSTVNLDASTVSGYEDEGLRIPLHTYVWDLLSATEKEEVASASVALNMQVEKKEYLDWYKTQGFLDVVKIVLVAVTIITAGQSNWFNALLAAGSIEAAALIILEAILYAIAINAAFDLAINVLGDNFVLIAAVIALVAAAYTGNMDFVLKIGERSFATNLLELATLSIEAIQRSTANEMDNLLAEEAEWDEGHNERQQALLDLEEMIDTDTGIDLMDTFYGGFYFNEKENAEMFYTRSLLTNIATPALSFPSTYVKDALNLDNIINEGY